MRLAFSTLGCSGRPLPAVVALARRAGAAGLAWTGLELRAAADEPVHTGLSIRQRAEVRAQLGELTPVCVASYVAVASDAVDDEQCIVDALAHAKLAADLGAGAVRVFPGAEAPGTGRHSPGGTARADARAVRRLRAIAEALPDGVEVWLETHDSHSRGADVARVLAGVGDPRVRAIWDVLHPWRAGEALLATVAALRPYLAHVQVKDVASPDVLTPVPLGDGVLPLAEMAAALRVIGYSGWFSLEWESRWHPEAVALEVALGRGAAYLRQIL